MVGVKSKSTGDHGGQWPPGQSTLNKDQFREEICYQGQIKGLKYLNKYMTQDTMHEDQLEVKSVTFNENSKHDCLGPRR